MKTRLSAALAAAAILLVAFAAVAGAATTNGKISKFKYDASSQSGKLTVLKGKKKKNFVISADTLCGVSYGQMGDEIPCKTLGKKKYKGKRVRVETGKNEAGKKVTTLVSVDLSRR